MGVRVRKHFRIYPSTIDYILSDMERNRYSSVNECLNSKIVDRINKLQIGYDSKVNRLLDTLILKADLEKYSIDKLEVLVTSIMRVTTALGKSLSNLVMGLEEMK